MSRLDLIAKRLNSVGLDADEAFKDVITDYFGESGSDYDSDSGSDDFAETVPSLHNLSTSQHAASATLDEPERQIFSYSISEDTSSVYPYDRYQDQTVSDFMTKICCNLKCTSKFRKDVVVQSRLDAQELNHFSDKEHINFLHVSMLGGMNCCVSVGEQTNRAKNKNIERQRVRGHFYFQGKPVCKDFYLFLYGVSDKVYRHLKTFLMSEGIVPKPHQNMVTMPRIRAHSVKIRQCAAKFIENFAIQNAVVLPGRVPGFKNPDLLLLPSEHTKNSIHAKYMLCVDPEMMIPYSTFTELWRELLPNICIQRPRSDLCAVCKFDTIALSKLRSLNEEKRRALLDQNLQHLNLVDQERLFYKNAIQQAKDSKQILGCSVALGKHPPCSFSGTSHYSFDYFQQVHVPSDPDQVGALYFLTPYKVGLFGIMCEAISKMALFIIPEGAVTGKGSNQVISMLHFYFQNLGLGEHEVLLNADNCVGQNKNQYVLSYLCWRVLCGLHKKIVLHFLVVGHTKFSPDYGGGVFKKIFRRTPCATPQDVADCAKQSSILHSIVTGSIDGQEQYVPMFDWQSKFASFRAIPNMKKYHVFEFCNERPGIVVCREHSDSQPVGFNLTSSKQCDTGLPAQLSSLGLSSQRQSYLFEKIRPFVPEEKQDILCPKPQSLFSEPEEPTATASNDTTSTAQLQHIDEPELGPSALIDDQPVPMTRKTEIERLATPKRKPPTCSNCGGFGHRNLPSQCPKRKSEV